MLEYEKYLLKTLVADKGKFCANSGITAGVPNSGCDSYLKTTKVNGFFMSSLSEDTSGREEDLL